MDHFILDASFALTWCFTEESTPLTNRIRDQLKDGKPSALVPTLWRLEISNTLLVALRRKRITEEQEAAYLSMLKRFPIDVLWMDDAREFEETHLLAKEHGLSAYDAAYLEMAIRENLPLATNDEPLKKAARAVGVRLVDDMWSESE